MWGPAAPAGPVRVRPHRPEVATLARRTHRTRSGVTWAAGHAGAGPAPPANCSEMLPRKLRPVTVKVSPEAQARAAQPLTLVTLGGGRGPKRKADRATRGPTASATSQTPGATAATVRSHATPVAVTRRAWHAGAKAVPGPWENVTETNAAGAAATWAASMVRRAPGAHVVAFSAALCAVLQARAVMRGAARCTNSRCAAAADVAPAARTTTAKGPEAVAGTASAHTTSDAVTLRTAHAGAGPAAAGRTGDSNTELLRAVNRSKPVPVTVSRAPSTHQPCGPPPHATEDSAGGEGGATSRYTGVLL